MSDSHQSQFERQLYPKTILYSSFMAFFFLPQIEIDGRIADFGDFETLTGKISYKNIDTNSQYITGLPIKILVYGK